MGPRVKSAVRGKMIWLLRIQEREDSKDKGKRVRLYVILGLLLLLSFVNL